MRIRLPLALVGFCSFLTACATTPTKLVDSQPVRPDRYLPDYRLYAKPSPHSAKVVVVRDDGTRGSAIKTIVTVNGHQLAGLFQNDRVEFYVTPGDHLLGLVFSPALGRGDKTHQFIFHADQTSRFRVGSFGFDLDIQPTAEIQ